MTPDDVERIAKKLLDKISAHTQRNYDECACVGFIKQALTAHGKAEYERGLSHSIRTVSEVVGESVSETFEELRDEISDAIRNLKEKES